MKSETSSAPNKIYAAAFGLFLGLCIWKFGNPVILDEKISPPDSFSEFWHDLWPTHWATGVLLPFLVAGIFLVLKGRLRWPASQWLWLLPSGWLGWQFLSATQTVDGNLTAATLWQFVGCASCYILGAFLFNQPRMRNLLLFGILAAFVFCLIRAVDQRLIEFPQSRQTLMEGQRTGWTNISPATFLEMKRDGVIIATNGMEEVNPAVAARFGKAPPAGLAGFHLLWYQLFASTPRVMGTLVYPNALAGIVLLLLPVLLTLAFGAQNLRCRRFMPPSLRWPYFWAARDYSGAGQNWAGSWSWESPACTCYGSIGR